MILTDPSDDPVELEPDDLLHHLVGDRIVRNDDQASEQGGGKTLRSPGRSDSTRPLALGVVSSSPHKAMVVSVPTLEVRRITVFLKSMTRLHRSSSVPLSKTWKNSSITSGRVFSTSSSRTSSRACVARFGEDTLSIADAAGRRALQA